MFLLGLRRAISVLQRGSLLVCGKCKTGTKLSSSINLCWMQSVKKGISIMYVPYGSLLNLSSASSAFLSLVQS